MLPDLKMNKNPSHHSLDTSESFIQDNPKSDIVFPNQTVNIAHIAVDIGGSLAKVVWFSKQQEGGRLNFRKFETAKMDQLVVFLESLLAERINGSEKVTIKATGGGAHKYQDLLESKLKIILHKEDEMESLITGLNFLVRQIENEVFTYDERRPQPMQFENTSGEIFPYILVNIGSGVSIIKVTSDQTYERISGTSLGGGTLWGLLGLLTDAKDYDEMLEISKKGDNKNVDMLVGDIYGGHYSKIGLKSSTIASSFGKVIKCPPEERKSSFKQEDIAVSLLYLVSNNIGQISYLNAKAHGINRIYFSGFYISGHPITMNTLSYAISFWSKGEMKAHFLRHEGYLGAVGAFLHDPPANARLSAFAENFSQVELGLNGKYALGSLQESNQNLKTFPLLRDPTKYSPDTIILDNQEVQQYWIDLLDLNLMNLVEMAVKKDADCKARAAMFESMYRRHLIELRQNPNAYGPLTIRGLLNLREQCLREMGFNDVFNGVKQEENAAALKSINQLFEKLDAITDECVLVENLFDNAIAGNMFDWGYILLIRSSMIQELLKDGIMDFDAAKAKIGRSDHLDHRELLKKQLVTSKPYQKAIVFLDNSGADLCFGMIPLARYLLKKGTKVVFAANSNPAVNDITASELEKVLHKISDPVIISSLAKKLLSVAPSGSSSPCLDFNRISEEVCSAAEDCDLVIIEGMGRAIHTNFYAKFSVDTIKVGSFKNPQIAAALGAKMYDGLLLFERV